MMITTTIPMMNRDNTPPTTPPISSVFLDGGGVCGSMVTVIENQEL